MGVLYRESRLRLGPGGETDSRMIPIRRQVVGAGVVVAALRAMKVESVVIDGPLGLPGHWHTDMVGSNDYR